MTLEPGSPDNLRDRQAIRLLTSLVISALGHAVLLGSGFRPPTLVDRSMQADSRLMMVVRLNGPLQREQQLSFAEESVSKLPETPLLSAKPAKNTSTALPLPLPPRPGVSEKLAGDEADVKKIPDIPPPIPPASTEASRFSEYRAVGLNPPPRPLHDIDPEFPSDAGLREGLVAIRLLIDEKGIVDDVVVIRSSPRGVFEDSAIQAFRSARFSPGMFLGIPVKSQLVVEVEFMPTNRGASVSGRSY